MENQPPAASLDTRQLFWLHDSKKTDSPQMPAVCRLDLYSFVVSCLMPLRICLAPSETAYPFHQSKLQNYFLLRFPLFQGLILHQDTICCI